MKPIRNKLILILSLLFISCNAAEEEYDHLFAQLSEDRYQFFNLLNDYPALKSSVSSLEPALFNETMFLSMNRNPAAGEGFLRLLSELLLDLDPSIQDVLGNASTLMQRARSDSNAFDQTMQYVDRLRGSQHPLLYDGMPFQRTGLQSIFDSSSRESVRDLTNRAANFLERPSVATDVTEIQAFLIKVLDTNPGTRSAIEELFKSSLGLTSSDGPGLFHVLGELTQTFRATAGFDGSTTAPVSMVFFLQRLNTYFYPGGAVYDADTAYQASEFPSNLPDQFVDLYFTIRPFLIANAAHTGSRPLIETLSENLSTFPEGMHQNADESLSRMIDLDAYGADRLNSVHSTEISALESLLFLLSLGNHFGYRWDANPSSPATITAATDGVLTVGDILHSLRSLIKGDPVLSLSGFLQDSQASGLVHRNGSVMSFGINSPALALMQGESRGSANSLADTGYTVYHRTVPYMMNWIVRAIYQGQAPYYNQNRTNGSGDFLTMDGTVYRTAGGTDMTYVPSWQTDVFRVRVRQYHGGGGHTDHYVGPSGYEDPTGNGTAFQVSESSIPPGERAVDSDLEALHKNYQWLLYKKRFVIVIPLHAKLGASGIQHAVYVTVVANGLMGLISARPYCNLADNQCYSNDNGRWSIAGTQLQPDFQTTSIRNNTNMTLTLQMSDEPGDHAIFVEAYGYGLTGEDTFGYADATLYQILYNTLLYPVPPSQFHGAIPPALSSNAAVLERLGFLTTGVVEPDEVNSRWDERNAMLPLVTALVRTLDEQTDPSSTQGAYGLLANAADVLARPYIFRGTDPESGISGLVQYRLEGSGPAFNIRSPALTATDYSPDSSYRSLISIAIESERRYKDGPISLLSTSDFLETTAEFLKGLGGLTHTASRTHFFDSLEDLLAQENLDSNNPSTTQLDISYEIRDLADFMGQYAATLSTDASHGDWVHIRTLTELAGEWLAAQSPNSLMPGLQRFVFMLGQEQPSDSETSALFTVFLSFISDAGSPAAEVSEFFQVQLPEILHETSDDFYYLAGALAGLSIDGGFFKYLNADMRNGFTSRDIYLDLERFLSSSMVQDKSHGKHSLIFAAGKLLDYLWQVREQGYRIPGPGQYWFDDHRSRDQNSRTPYEWLNSILSIK
ncbi:MAG: hypothetical protein RH862_08930 [Leptospiraceae bacterium]